MNISDYNLITRVLFIANSKPILFGFKYHQRILTTDKNDERRNLSAIS